jgi:hypothetical protein
MADLAHIAAFLAARIRSVVDEGELAEYDRVLALLSEAGPGPELRYSLPVATSAPMAVLNHACMARIRGDAYHALQETSFAARGAMKALQRANAFDAATALIRDLDALIVAREWQAILDAHREGAPAIGSLLWRGADERGELGHVLVRTRDGGLAHLGKAARRWRWHTGSRDDVLATIPDAHFEEAARRAR